ncbi:hypothetical protein ISU07_17165 [Nocardioides islandensis]|uniref:Uncharacterized protein n=1 Tax=Nocardioides islandensis TaxID=433663 RepID=A0A930VE36_9ACTN|nr:DUF5682 family protein [Nocardioides islandensis]MBF4764867.1 hypothetical protein [Nocardioides islandensis]
MTVDVHILGIRHHGPGSARSVARALDELRPDAVLVEGAPELDRVVAMVAEEDMRPPVAGLVYAVDEPRRALFYPLATFSPEWVAVRWALAHGVPVRFADLPVTHQLTDPPQSDRPAPGRSPRPDPIGMLAQAAGYDDPERWWEDAVEHRGESSLERFAAVKAAMAAVRETDERPDDDPDVVENARREAAMRKAVRETLRTEGVERVAFVCGAYHAPALDPATYPSVAHDNALLKGLPKTKVAATWAPWSSGRLALASGYGAGVTSPGWYQHLFDHWSRDGEDDDLATTWLVRVARELRGQQLDASTASVVEASRLASTLAAVRGRPSVGLTELDDAAESVLCEGSRVPLRLVHDSLVVGRELGSVPAGAPMVPLAADLARQQRATRLKPAARSQTVTLDLRRDAGLARSVLLHRLRVLGVDWGTEADAGRSTGTFKEAWELEWRPELAVSVIEAGLFGTTVEAAAATRVHEQAERATDLATLGRLVSECLLGDLPEGLRSVVASLEERTAQQHDVLALLGAVEPLARTVRYGDVRGVDVAGVATVLRALVIRASVGLPAACVGLDDDAAAAMRAAVEGAQRGVALLEDEGMRRRWEGALVAVAARDHVHGSVAGRVDRLLLDAGRVDQEEAAVRMSRRLSLGAPATDAAAWLDGFLSGESVLLVHDPDLLTIVDAWVGSIGEAVFEDLLPLLRRTFSRFQAAERATIARQVARLGRSEPTASATSTRLDLDRARPAVAKVAALLGLEVTP